MLRIKRVYESSLPKDGRRFLVDRLWPRGLSKGRAAIDEWRRDLAPSYELRRWYGHQPDRWEEFSRRYREELADARGSFAPPGSDPLRIRQITTKPGHIKVAGFLALIALINLSAGSFAPPGSDPLRIRQIATKPGHIKVAGFLALIALIRFIRRKRLINRCMVSPL